MKNMKKIIALVAALVLVLAIGIGGTLAYLTSTATVTNTFTIGKVKITLVEHKYDANYPDQMATTSQNPYGEEVSENSYTLIPGQTYFKDPTVKVEDDSEDCYLFVKLDVKNNKTDGENSIDIVQYEAFTDEGWIQGTGTGESGNGVPDNVWYRTVKQSDSTKSWKLLKDNKVKINDELTNDNMPSTDSKPTLKFTAYAIQKAGFDTDSSTVATAWAKVSTTTSGS